MKLSKDQKKIVELIARIKIQEAIYDAQIETTARLSKDGLIGDMPNASERAFELVSYLENVGIFEKTEASPEDGE